MDTPNPFRAAVERAVTARLLQQPLPVVQPQGAYVAWPTGGARVVKQPRRRWRRCSWCLLRRAMIRQQFCRACAHRLDEPVVGAG